MQCAHNRTMEHPSKASKTTVLW